MARIEILHIRDPDDHCNHIVFVDGVQVNVAIEDVDPGYGYSTVDEWNEGTKRVAKNYGYSEAFGTAVLEARNAAAENSPYIAP